MNFESAEILDLIDRCLAEDIGGGDHSSMASIPEGTMGESRLLLKQDGVVAGLALGEVILRRLDPNIEWVSMASDGDYLLAGTQLAAVKGRVHALLAGERLMLNFMQRLSGVATQAFQAVKLVEGTMASVPPQGGRKHPNQDFLQVDTTNILFICGGAFDGLEKVIQQRTVTAGIGFGAQVRGKDDRSISELLQEVQTEDLIKFGLIPELIGRLPVVATLAQLDEAALVQILTEPNNALVKQYQALLDMEGVELEVRPNALSAIAKKAIARKTGARGLRSIIEHALMDVMYDLPSLENVQRVVIDESTINGDGKPLMLYQEASEKAAS